MYITSRYNLHLIWLFAATFLLPLLVLYIAPCPFYFSLRSPSLLFHPAFLFLTDCPACLLQPSCSNLHGPDCLRQPGGSSLISKACLPGSACCSCLLGMLASVCLLQHYCKSLLGRAFCSCLLGLACFSLLAPSLSLKPVCLRLHGSAYSTCLPACLRLHASANLSYLPASACHTSQPFFLFFFLHIRAYLLFYVYLPGMLVQ